MMNLFIDTASSRIIIAIIKDNKIVGINNLENGHDLSDRIFPIMDDTFKLAGISPNEVDTIYVVNGPGSFTGVRIGVTIAKSMAWALKKKIIAISELELLATTKVDSEYIVPFIDARRNASFAAIYDQNLDTSLADCYIKNEELLSKLPANSVFVSYENSEVFKNIIKPNVDILRIIELHKNDKLKNPHEINPEYLKLTEAEENLKKSI